MTVEEEIKTALKKAGYSEEDIEEILEAREMANDGLFDLE